MKNFFTKNHTWNFFKGILILTIILFSNYSKAQISSEWGSYYDQLFNYRIGYGPMFTVPDSIYQKRDSISGYYDINAFNFYSPEPYDYFYGELNLSDEIFFQYLGIVYLSPDTSCPDSNPGDTVGSYRHAYRFIYSGFPHSDTCLAYGGFWLHNKYDSWNTGFSFSEKACTEFIPCVTRMNMVNINNELLYHLGLNENPGFCEYNNGYSSSLSSDKKQAVVTILNWLFNANASENDYIDVLNEDSVNRADVPSSFCPSYIHSCNGAQQEVFTYIKSFIDSAKLYLDPSSQSGNRFSETEEAVLNHFRSSCLGSSAYFAVSLNIILPYYSFFVYPLKANFPIIIARIIYDAGSSQTFSTIAYKYVGTGTGLGAYINYPDHFTEITYEGGGLFSYHDGYAEATNEILSGPVANAGTDTALCHGLETIIGGAPVATGGESPYTYLWSPASGLTSSADENPTASPAKSTFYILTVTDKNRCEGTDTVLVRMVPEVYAGRDTTICFGMSTLIGGDTVAYGGTEPYYYEWSPSDGLDSDYISNPTAEPAETTTYILTVTDDNACVGRDTVIVTVNNPVAHAGSDTAIYYGFSTTIGASPAASGGITPYTYSWNPASDLSSSAIAQPAANPTAATTYTLTVTDANNCIASDDIIVTVNTIPVAYAGRDTTLYYGTSTILGNNPAATGGVPPYTYRWAPATGLSSPIVAQPVAYPSGTTTYSLAVSDKNNYTVRDSVVVTMNFMPGLYIIPDTESCPSSFAFYQNLGQIIDTDDSVRHDVNFYTTTHYPALYIRSDTMSYVFSRINTDTSSAAEDTLARVDMFLYHDLDEHHTIGSTYPYMPVPQYLNYFLPQCPDGIVNVEGYQKVVVNSIHEGVDIVYAANEKGLKYYISCDPNLFSPGSIAEKFVGYDSLYVDSTGTLHITTSIGEMTFEEPTAYELDSTGYMAALPWTPSFMVFDEGIVRFDVGEYDYDKRLVFKVMRGEGEIRGDNCGGNCDWSTYVEGADEIRDVRTRTDGQIYVIGETFSQKFPVTTGAYQGKYNLYDIGIMSFFPNGKRNWATFFGQGWGKGIDIDENSNVYFTGLADGVGFPISPNAYQTNYGGGMCDAFIAKLNPTGNIRLWATFIGGSGYEEGKAIRYIGGNRIVVVGEGDSNTPHTSYGSYNVNGSGLLAMFNSGTGQPIWVTNFGSASVGTSINSIDYDFGHNKIYIVGSATDDGLPTSGAYSNLSYMGGDHDAFTARISPSGAVDWCTYIGGENDDIAWDIVFISDNENGQRIALTGETNSDYTSFVPLVNNGHYYDDYMYPTVRKAFITQLEGPYGEPTWSTFYGGRTAIILVNQFNIYGTSGRSITADSDNRIYITGWTSHIDLDMPIVDHDKFYYQELGSHYCDAFLACFNSSRDIEWATYFGGADVYPEPNLDESGYSLAAYKNEKLYLVGYSVSEAEFPFDDGAGVPYYYDIYPPSYQEGFISRFSLDISFTGAESLIVNSRDIKLFPNPNNGNFIINIPGEFKNIYWITVTDVLGREILKYKTQNKGSFRINAANLPKGMYNIQISDDRNVYSGKIIIQ